LSVYYLDTSALVKLYVREPGTEQMLRLADPACGHTLALLGLTPVEFRSAVRQRERAGDVAHDIADNLIDSLDEHVANFFLVQPLTDLVIQEAAALLDRHALRAYDAVQLAGCIMLRARLGRHATFVCSDRQLVKAAEDEGMTVIDPSVEA
jgi:uncharacterized protein